MSNNSLPADKIISYKGDVLTGPSEVEGYEQLSDQNKLLFAEFLRNFYEAWEFPENHLPVRIKYVANDAPNLRVDFAQGGWLHIISPTLWY